MTDRSDIPVPQKVLIIKPSALGDVVTAMPVLRGLRRTFGPGVHIGWLVSKSCAGLLEGQEGLDEIVVLDRGRFGRMHRSPSAAAGFIGFCRRLRQAGYDWVIDLQGLFRSGFLARVSGAAVRAGLGLAREGAGLFYTHVLPAAQCPLHTVQRNIALARMLGIDARDEDFALDIPPQGRQFAESFARRHGSYVVLAPTTRWQTKLYPARHWKVVIEALARRYTVALLAGPGEAHLTAPLAGLKHVVDLSEKTSLPEMVGLIGGARGLISGDSASMHVAAALAVPQVVIVGPTDPDRTGPFSRKAVIVQTTLPCRACRLKKCPHISCMQLISPAEILAAAEQAF